MTRISELFFTKKKGEKSPLMCSPFFFKKKAKKRRSFHPDMKATTLPKLKSTSRACASCLVIRPGLRLSKEFKDVSYCSIECQKKDWSTHKSMCQPLCQPLQKEGKYIGRMPAFGPAVLRRSCCGGDSKTTIGMKETTRMLA